MTNSQRAANFISYFRREVEVVAGLQPAKSSDVEFHKKMLYCAMLDCLAGIRYKGGGVGKRFVDLLREHTNWSEGSLVSVPVCLERLSKSQKKTPLWTHLAKILGKYPLNRGNSLPVKAFDMPVEELVPLATTKREKDLIEQSQHDELLYKYRNFIVHEFREPGYAMEDFADEGSEPLYHSYSGPQQKWRLLYPLGLFRARVTAALDSLGQYFEDQKIDPYTLVRKSDDWFC